MIFLALILFLTKNMSISADLENLHHLSEQGDSSATLSLSRHYLSDSSQDFEKAIFFLEKGVQQKNPQCCLLLSRLYRKAFDWTIPSDVHKSILYLKVGEELDDDSCRCELGNLYRTGYENGSDYLAADYKKAAEFFHLSKDNGSTVGPVMLALMYKDGQIEDSDIIQFSFSLLPYIEEDNRARVMLENEARKKEYSHIIALSRSAYIYNNKFSYLEIAKIYLKKKERAHHALFYFKQAAAGIDGLAEARAWSAILEISKEREIYVKSLQEDSSFDAQYWLGFFLYKMTDLSNALNIWDFLADKGHKLSLLKLIDVYKRSTDFDDWKIVNNCLEKGCSLSEGHKIFKILLAKTHVTGQFGCIDLIKASDIFYELDQILFVKLKRLLKRPEYWNYIRSFIEKKTPFKPDCIREFLI